MTKYKRFTGKVFGGTATATGNDPQISQFGSALAGTFTGTTDPEVIQSLPAWGQGWIGAVTPNTQFPALPEMTGAMKVFSYLICYLLQQGVAEWDSNTIYYKNNYCSLNGNIYISLSDSNQNNNPTTDSINWKNFLADKLNLDASNLDSQGKSYVSELGFPSVQHNDLTIGPTAQKYTAPATGWVYADCASDQQGKLGRIYLVNVTTGISFRCNRTIETETFQGFIPVRKGEQFALGYNGNLKSGSGTTKKLQFIYSRGEV